MPYLVVIGGPNGAGKSTVAPGLLAGYLGITTFVNADVIARGLSGFDPDGANIEAGKVMLRRLRELAGDGEDFAFETTLASRSFAGWIAELQAERGYRFLLNYVWSGSVETCLRRVEGRARAGDHSVPPEVVHRRYSAGLRNFFELYRPISDAWAVFDNSRAEIAVRPVADGTGGRVERVYDPATWNRIRYQQLNH